ncbi:hypothetical protein [Shewanella woodyi]|uniref:Uncharacterized protein n=1 Tax=Shewanella woodyi (strain ATCC 51908 / MS32) TaxID=392500 RepID=B1KF71_SHEWM|nr:hypothetical protein [Shewanella woodyi]ACA86612.1 hypothetical protein Swoo_2333 [Shewanella woodyi ATCC 51908]
MIALIKYHQKAVVLAIVLTLVFGMILAIVSSASYLQANNQFVVSTASQQLTFNRYQAGFVCRERGWEFCTGWSYSTSRLA